MSTTVELRNVEVARLGDFAETLAWSPDSRRLVVGSLAGDAVLVGVPGEHADLVELDGHLLGTAAASWAPNGTMLATAGQDGSVALYDAAGSRLGGGATGQGWAAHLAWRPDSTCLAAAIGRQVVWMNGSGLETARTELPAAVAGLMWTPDGKRLGVAAYGGVWWFDADATPNKHFAWKGAPLTLHIAPNGKFVATGNQDNSVHCWRLWSGDDFQMSGYETKIQHIAWSTNSRFLAVAGLDDLTIWDFSGRGPQGTKPRRLSGHTRHPVALEYRPVDDGVLMSAAADGRVCIWNPRSGRKPLLAQSTMGSPIAAAHWSPDGRWLAVTTADGGALMMEVEA